MLLFSKSFSESISFSVSIQNCLCYPNKEKTCTLLFIADKYFPCFDPNERITQHIIIVIDFNNIYA